MSFGRWCCADACFASIGCFLSCACCCGWAMSASTSSLAAEAACATPTSFLSTQGGELPVGFGCEEAKSVAWEGAGCAGEVPSDAAGERLVAPGHAGGAGGAGCARMPDRESG